MGGRAHAPGPHPFLVQMPNRSLLINGRSATVAEKPAFPTALRRRRCLIPANGFYEWQRLPGTKAKHPMRIVLMTEEPFAFAGLWQTWKHPDGQVITSCAIITTDANRLLAPIYHRMPVILSAESEALWLDGTVNGPVLLCQLLLPYDADAMESYEVSALVNSVRNDTPEVIVRVE